MNFLVVRPSVSRRSPSVLSEVNRYNKHSSMTRFGISIRRLLLIGSFGLVFTGSALASSPGDCPSANLAAITATAKAQLARAGLPRIHGSCVHTGVYWGKVWHVDCTFLTGYAEAMPKVPKEIVKHGLITKAGFNDVQATSTGWSISYIAGETNTCAEPEGSSLVSGAVKSGPHGD